MQASRFARPLAVSILISAITGLPSCAAPPERGALGLSAPINGLVRPSAGDTSGWSLPISGPLGAGNLPLKANDPAVNQNSRKELKGRVSLSPESDRVGRRVNQLLDAALALDPQTEILDAAVAHFRSVPMKLVAQAKDATNFSIPYQGFGPSSEAGDIVLDEKIKLKSRASAEYARQKHIDETHAKVVTSIMQVAMGLGMSDRGRGQQTVSTGLASLRSLVGDSEADKTLQMLSTWAKGLSIPGEVYAQGVWDVAQRKEKFKTVMENALDNDPVVQEIQNRLHKYNHRSTFARVSAHVVETALGVAGMAPDFVGAGAKAALTAFVMATGGPEQSKILKELYLDKRFESRWKVLSEEAHLALDNYHVAILTRNPVLIACSEALLKTMTDTNTIITVCGRSVLEQQKLSNQAAVTGDLAPAGSAN